MLSFFLFIFGIYFGARIQENSSEFIEPISQKLSYIDFINWFDGHEELRFPVFFAIILAIIGMQIELHISEKNARKRREQEKREESRRRNNREKFLLYASKYPEATKKFIHTYWNTTIDPITNVNDSQIEKLLIHTEIEYQICEEELNPIYKNRVEAERRRVAEEAERSRRAEEAERRRKAEEAERRRILAEKFNYSSIGGFRYGYCFDYYPVSRFPSVSYQDQENRRSVWNFKDGAYSIGLKYLKDFIDGNYTREEMKNLAVCVIPASTVSKNNLRFKTLCSKIAEELPIINGFDFISIAYDRNDSREHKSSNTVANLNFSNSVYGKNVVLVDDVTTRGTSFLQVATQLKQKGALSVTGFFLGKTYSL